MPRSDSKRLILSKDIIHYGLLTAFSRGLQFLMLPLLTRLFSPADYGLVDLMATVTGFATILMSLSLESAVARMWHEPQSLDQRKRLLTSVIVFVFICGTGIFLMFWAASGMLSRLITGSHGSEAIISIAVGTALLLAILSIPQMALRMERRILRFGFLQIANSVLGIIFPLVLIIRFGMGLTGLFLGTLAAASLTLLLSLYWTRHYLARPVFRQDLTECLKFSLPLVPAVIISWGNRQVDRIILLSFLGLGAVGTYGAAAKIAMIIGSLVVVFRMAWLPLAMKNIASSSRNAYFRRTLTGYLAAMICLGLGLSTYSRELLVFLTTKEYSAGYIVIPWLIGAQIFYGSGNITNIGMLISKKTAGNSIAALFGAVVNVTLS